MFVAYHSPTQWYQHHFLEMFQSQDTLKYNYSQICGILLSL